MTPADWKRQGHLTPDIPDLQKEAWALLATQQQRLAVVLEELAIRTAEPTWAATLRDGAGRSLDTAEALIEEAGPAALDALGSDELLGEFLSFQGEVETSGHVPSLIVCGYAVLGELGAVPGRLLEEVAGPHGKLIAARFTACESHRPLKGLLHAADPSPMDLERLRKLVRHCNGLLFGVYRSWRQTFHTLGVDGEWIDEQCHDAARTAHHDLGMKWSRTDARVFGA